MDVSYNSFRAKKYLIVRTKRYRVECFVTLNPSMSRKHFGTKISSLEKSSLKSKMFLKRKKSEKFNIYHTATLKEMNN